MTGSIQTVDITMETTGKVQLPINGSPFNQMYSFTCPTSSFCIAAPITFPLFCQQITNSLFKPGLVSIAPMPYF